MVGYLHGYYVNIDLYSIDNNINNLFNNELILYYQVLGINTVAVMGEIGN